MTAVTADWISTLRDVQMTPPWGIDRIDDRETTDDTYEYTAQAGNVTVYVIDTGEMDVIDTCGMTSLTQVKLRH